MFSPGSRVFCPDAEEGWVLATVVEQSGTQVTVSVSDNAPPVLFSSSVLVVAPSSDSDTAPDDLTVLGSISEPLVLHSLRGRFAAGRFYTWIGPILLAVNPYQKLKIYGTDTMARYKAQRGTRAELPPHVFAVAQAAFQGLMRDAKPQSILVSGESGAGKTETTKLLLQHLALVSSQATQANNLAAQILDANPVLEAFGNAKTVRNDNSSRFGKFIKIYFDGRSVVSGGIIEQYLLETTRIVAPSHAERNFHIFYQLCAGCTDKESEALYLKGRKPQSFRYLHNGPVAVEGVDDAAEFETVRLALVALGFEQKEIVSVWRVVAAILHVGDVQFAAGERTRVVNADVLQCATKLFGVEAAALAKCLTNRGFQGGNRKSGYAIPLTGDQAEAARDGFAKAVYLMLFEWLVGRINERIAPSKAGTRFIGLLDIFGFESFGANSLEQLLINMANESLQDQFNQVFFQHEQSEYRAEGITWNAISYRDNSACVALLQGPKTGILRMLCEEGRLPQCSDERLLSKVCDAHRSSKFFATPKRGAAGRDCFEVKHYARSVVYSVTGFLDKNRDIVSPEVVALAEDSSSRFLRALFESRTNAKKAAKNTSVTDKFLAQLASLSEQLDRTERHYIRCVRPNSISRRSFFDGKYALEQLLASGVMETVMIRKAGFGHRLTFDEFAELYQLLLRKAPADKRELAEAVLQKRLGKLGTGHALGRTKVFLRDEAKALLDTKVEEMRRKAALIIAHAYLRAQFKVKFVAVVRVAKQRRLEREKREREERERREREEREKREREEREKREREEREKREREEREKREREKREREERERQQRLQDEQARRREEMERLAAEEAEAERERRAVAEKMERARVEAERERELADAKAKMRAERDRNRHKTFTAASPPPERGTATKKGERRTQTLATSGTAAVTVDVYVLGDVLVDKGRELARSVSEREDDVHTMMELDTLVAQFRSEAESISESRTYAKALRKVVDQVKALLQAARSKNAATCAAELEALTKALIAWKQTALALGGKKRPAAASPASASPAPASVPDAQQFKDIRLPIRGRPGAHVVYGDISPAQNEWVSLVLRAGVIPTYDDADDEVDRSRAVAEEEQAQSVLRELVHPSYFRPNTQTTWCRAHLLAAHQPQVRRQLADASLVALAEDFSRAANRNFTLQARVLAVRNAPAGTARLEVCWYDGTAPLREKHRVPAGPGETRFDLCAPLLTLADVPPDAQLRLILRNASDQVLAWCNLSALDHEKCFVHGKIRVRLFVGSQVVVGVSTQNWFDGDAAPIAFVEVDSDGGGRCVIPTASQMPSVTPGLLVSDYSSVHDLLRRPNHGLATLTQLEREEVWENRLLLLSDPGAMPVFIQSVPWSKVSARKQAHMMLHHWASPVDPADALAVLSPVAARSLDPLVRQWAARAGSRYGRWMLPLLACALRYEPHHHSALHQVVLGAALRDAGAAALVLWSMFADLQVPWFAERAAFVVDLVARYAPPGSGVDSMAAVVRAVRSGSALPFPFAHPFDASLRLAALQHRVEHGDETTLIFNGDVQWIHRRNVRARCDVAAAQSAKLMQHLWHAAGVFTTPTVLGVHECVALSSDDVLCGGPALHERSQLFQADDASSADQASLAALCVSSWVLGDCDYDTLWLLPSGAVHQTHHTVGPGEAFRVPSLAPATLDLACRALEALAPHALALCAVRWLVEGAQGDTAVDADALFDREAFEKYHRPQ